jgi:hypothetical protein
MHAWESEKHATLYEANKFKTRKVISDILKIIYGLRIKCTPYNEILKYITKHNKISIFFYHEILRYITKHTKISTPFLPSLIFFNEILRYITNMLKYLYHFFFTIAILNKFFVLNFFFNYSLL